MPKERRFYCPPQWEKILDELEKILKREGKSLSSWIRENAVSYVELHRPGNPQQRLDIISEVGHAYRAESCCICAKTAEVQAFTKRGLNLLYCRECYEEKGRLVTTGYRECKRKSNRSF